MIEAARLAPELSAAISLADFAADVRDGLTKPGQKELYSKYLYDEIGSALFEAICLLPEYGLSRAGARLLEQNAEEISRLIPGPVMVAELGSGTGGKTRWMLQALAKKQNVNYYPIDISRAALDRCDSDLGRLESVSIVGFERAYLDGLLEAAARRRPGMRLLVLFLGSTIGNFDRPAGDRFLRSVRQILQTGDALLLATDLEKAEERVLLAYDDPAGVTAAFNLNLLARINRELGADFDLSRFRHLVRYDRRERRVEMHLESTADQIVDIPRASLRVRFAMGETIWTESCHKYTCAEAVQMSGRTGFRCEAQWVDAEWPFAQSLWIAG
ncbi:MAG TPA: L-histidine N(alpha)-methyltransferase [Candidatus Acidoferrales bacterium]|nr:L-histidine N(alpha)-methyltransferase [Candidatus Acidoferrales bacterium]